jgi:flagellar assembly factor FliW
MNDLADPGKVPVAELKRERVLQVPLGLLGFEGIKQYSLITNPDEEPFLWLQAVGDPSLSFLVVPTFDVAKDYNPEIGDEDAAFLGLDSQEDAWVYGIVTLHRNRPATVNLKGPIIVNRHTLRAKQVVLNNAVRYAIQHPIVDTE